ncbi:MAG: PAS domain S-box protein, partial [Acetobacteraceae bacterium]
RRRILHLEDSLIDAELVAAHLARSETPYTIDLVTTRAAYEGALARQNFDLIIADYVLPDFNGLEALELAIRLAPETPFIFVSGTLGEEAAVDAVKQGATDYVVKQRLARLPLAVSRALSDARSRREQRESQERLSFALNAGRLGAWELDLRSQIFEASETCRAIFGQPADAMLTYDDLYASVHPDDRARVQAALARSVTESADYDIEYRVIWPDGTLRWVQVRGQAVRAANGTPIRMAGVSLDATERKRAEERQALLSREVDHRAKNALAVVQAMLRLTKADNVPHYVRAIEGRVAALARAQTLLADDRWTGTDLRLLLQGELAPFLERDGKQVALDGPPVALPALATQPLAMATHELATNALKYGALSVPEGRLRVSWRVVPQARGPALLRLRWAESGGPPISAPPVRRGFGSRVLDGTVRDQLGGRATQSWAPDGLVCDLEVPVGLPATAIAV